MDVGLGDGLALAVLVGDAAAHALVTQPDVAVEPVGRRADALVHEMDGLLAHHRVFDVADDLLPGDGLDVMGVDVADQPVLEVAPARVALGMGQQLAGIGEDACLLRRQQLRDGSGGRIHRSLLIIGSRFLRRRGLRRRMRLFFYSSSGRRRYHSASSIGPRWSARNSSDTAQRTSVAVMGSVASRMIGAKERSSPSALAT